HSAALTWRRTPSSAVARRRAARSRAAGGRGRPPPRELRANLEPQRHSFHVHVGLEFESFFLAAAAEEETEAREFFVGGGRCFDHHFIRLHGDMETRSRQSFERHHGQVVIHSCSLSRAKRGISGGADKNSPISLHLH